jgi:hypothetical protein
MSTSTALAKIEAAEKKGALVFVDREWIEEKTPLYKPEITEMKIDKGNDCFNISGKFMPKREVVDRIGDANGIDFIFGEVKPMTIEDDMCGKRIVYSAKAQGRKRMSDGSWRTSSIQDYDFDPVLRAMLDYDEVELNAKTKQKKRRNSRNEEYGSTLARYILELQKVAPQRASTGARLRVIRELVGMPVAFAEKEIENPLVFGRIIQNTEYILKTPEGRAMATAKALDIDMSTLFGTKKPVLPPSAAETEGQNTPPMNTAEQEPEDNGNTANLANQAADDDVDFPAEEGEAETEEQIEFKETSVLLEQFAVSYKEVLNIKTQSGTNPYELAIAELDNKNATLESRKKMVDRVRDFLIKKKVPGVA